MNMALFLLVNAKSGSRSPTVGKTLGPTSGPLCLTGMIRGLFQHRQHRLSLLPVAHPWTPTMNCNKSSKRTNTQGICKMKRTTNRRTSQTRRRLLQYDPPREPPRCMKCRVIHGFVIENEDLRVFLPPKLSPILNARYQLSYALG